jgi:hypothetical protein
MNASPGIPCIVCGGNLTLRTARGRKSGKVFLMLLCGNDPRHFRGFVNDRSFVDSVLSRLEGQTPPFAPGGDVDANPAPNNGSKTKMERDNS